MLIAGSDDFVLAHRKLRSDPPAADRDVQNVKNFLQNHGRGQGENHGPIAEVECKYIETDGDLVSLVPKVKTPLRRLLDHFDIFVLLRIFKVQPVNEDAPWTVFPNVLICFKNQWH